MLAGELNEILGIDFIEDRHGLLTGGFHFVLVAGIFNGNKYVANLEFGAVPAEVIFELFGRRLGQFFRHFFEYQRAGEYLVFDVLHFFFEGGRILDLCELRLFFQYDPVYDLFDDSEPVGEFVEIVLMEGRQLGYAFVVVEPGHFDPVDLGQNFVQVAERFSVQSCSGRFFLVGGRPGISVPVAVFGRRGFFIFFSGGRFAFFA
jgi:hypothetical protein